MRLTLMTTKKAEYDVEATPDMTVAALIGAAEVQHPGLRIKDVLLSGRLIDDRGQILQDLGKGLLSRFCATIREIRDFNREIYGTNRESVCIDRPSARQQNDCYNEEKQEEARS
eukprot:SAG31_NODE_4957_length_2836_cov_2.451023_1_plen_114_part_00